MSEGDRFIGMPLAELERRYGTPRAGDFSIGSDVWAGTSKLIEEMGELGQVLGKLIGSGGNTAHFDGSDLRQRLIEEIGDVLGAVSYFMEANDLRHCGVYERKIRKYNLFWEWHGAAQGIEAAKPSRRETGSTVGESPVPTGCAQEQSGQSPNSKGDVR